MAKVMDLKIVAEGVEKVQQLEWLRQEGIDEYQGYFCSPPVELEKAQFFIQRGFNHCSTSKTIN
jgi:EAL domain-containing protein (putative c-di-GMP-specific phosphodiesterase class I)